MRFLFEELENQLKQLQAAEQARKKREGHQEQQVGNGFATFYFDRALDAYLDILSILKPYAERPRQWLDLIEGRSDEAQDLRQLFREIDSLRFVPRIFHPRFSRSKSEYFFQGDRRCYELALRIRDFVRELKTRESGKKFFELTEKKYGLKFREIFASLERRIHCYEFNWSEKDNYRFREEAKAILKKALDNFAPTIAYKEQLLRYQDFMASLEIVDEKAPVFARIARANFFGLRGGLELGGLINPAKAKFSESPSDSNLKENPTDLYFSMLKNLNPPPSAALNIHLARLGRMMKNPGAYKKLEEPRPLDLKKCEEVLDKALEIAEVALEKDPECAHFLRDESQRFIEENKSHDYYRHLLLGYFKNDSNAFWKYCESTEVERVFILDHILQDLKRLSEAVILVVKSYPLLGAKLEKLQVLMENLQEKIDSSEEEFKKLESQIKGSSGVLNLLLPLIDHFSAFENFRSNSIKFFNATQNQLISSDFYFELQGLLRSAEEIRKLEGSALKCASFLFVDELRKKLKIVKGNFEQAEDHKNFSGYQLVCKTLIALIPWPEPEKDYSARIAPQFMQSASSE